ncbi:ubiquitin C-terminal hydrolase 12-like [Quercus robur]|uniref:ubiquitin C-terminal hydrolase 12-like n=1 Tax=Quercus robur TaxID=38942 RepID=UPI002161DD6D|nr:ubiquitin C-terminal hydrolase 12-like [Quercus robur]
MVLHKEDFDKPKSEVMGSKSSEGFAITRTARHFRPTHFLLKIQSYSLLCETGVEKYESGVFEAGGHKWRLSLYPKGNKKMNGTDHISLYLSIVNTEKYSLGWEVYATFKLFVFDQIRDKFLTIQDAEGTIRRFHDIKMEWGFDKFLPLDSFNDLPNGYLVNDCCVFGAEVFVHERSAKRDYLSMIKEPSNRIMTWKIENYSTQQDKVPIYSRIYVVGDLKWKLLVYPKGIHDGANKAISVFLYSVDCVTPDLKIFAEFKLRIKDQINHKHAEEKSKYWFSAAFSDWGFSQLLLRKDLEDTSKGFLVDDTLIVEAEIMVMSIAK